MILVKRKSNSVVGQCENCNRTIVIQHANLINPRTTTIDLKTAVQCECGDYHNLIVDEKKHHVVSSAPRSASYYRPEEEPLSCPSCKSTQIHAGDKGFGLGKAVAGHLVIGPLGLLGGFLGHKKTMITCLKCGYKWQAGK
jgi:hypothetical protein